VISVTTTQSQVKVEVNPNKCTLCKLCVIYCPTHVFSLINNKITADSTKCVECYGCIPLCPSSAIKIEVHGNSNSRV